VVSSKSLRSNRIVGFQRKCLVFASSSSLMSFRCKQRMYPRVCVKARISCICGCTFFQFVSVIGGDSNTHVVRGESSFGFRTSTV